jgi:dTDP-4-amino-4,6-dideoxygalactose transaminase
VNKPAPVPLLDLQRQYQPIRDEILNAIARVCDSQHFVLGTEVEALELELAAFTGTAAAVGCSSGTDALWLALQALGVQPGDSVITTTFSFFASASSIARIGARPVFVDVDPRTLDIDPAAVRAKLRVTGAHKVTAIIPVHLYGQCADMSALTAIASEFEIPILEDAAQAIGAKWDGRNAGSMGAAAAFSFYPTKNLSAYGDAGAVTTPDPELADRMRSLRNHGSKHRYYHEELGWNTRMDAIQAAVLRVKLKYIDEWNRQRGERAALYKKLLADTGLLAKTNSSIAMLDVASQVSHVFHQFVVRAQRRDSLREFLGERKIATEIYYPLPLHLQPALTYLGFRQGDFPEAEQAAREVLALPMFPELGEEEQKWVVESIAEFYS